LEYVSRPAPSQPVEPPAERIMGPDPMQPQERIIEPTPSQPIQLPAEYIAETHEFVEQPKHVGESHSIIEKIKYPFIRIAESVSPSYMQRRYLAELEEKGIIEHMEPIDKTPG